MVNPYGSTAGAGSGEFHVYRHARAREMERMKHLDEEEKEGVLEKEYRNQLEQYKTEEEERTEKRRKKRKRQKEAKMRKKNLQLAGVISEVGDLHGNQVEQEEFTYNPVHEQTTGEAGNDKRDEKTAATSEVNKVPFANDGSFLEQMKKRLAEQQQGEKKENDKSDEEEESRPKKKQESC